MNQHTHPSKNPGREKLIELYVDKKMSCPAIAEMYGVPITTPNRWLITEGIPRRSVSEARFLAKKPVHSEETLERMRARAAAMREKLTPESHAKQAEKMRGRSPSNKGMPWTPEQRRKNLIHRADPEYRQMMSEKFKGENSVHWKGGSKPEHMRFYDSAWWRRRRKEVYERDQWVCQECGVKCLSSAGAKNYKGRRIQAHHIIPRRNGGSDELSNLETLCTTCHMTKERNFSPNERT